MVTEMKQEQMAMVMDMDSEADEEADDVYSGILGEIGLGLDQGAAVGTKALPV